MSSEPFWEASYRDWNAPTPFGQPAQEVLELASDLTRHSRVLDLGCGDGRNALALLREGFEVTAVDVSEAAIGKLKERAARYEGLLRAHAEDVRMHKPEGLFQLVIAHGLLHLLPRTDSARLLETMRAHTSPAGYNVVAVFTDRMAPPEDLEALSVGLFREGELLESYSGWRILASLADTLEDEHPGGLRHLHPVNKVVAQKPAE